MKWNFSVKNRMLIALAIMTFFFSVACSKEDNAELNLKTELEWFKNLETALEIAKVEKKAVLINFTGSDWCPWCWRLRDEVFVQKEFADYAKESLILVELDFPRNLQQTEETKQYNQTLSKKYSIRAFPTVLVLNADGKLLLQTGYEAGGPLPYIAKIKEYIVK
jgi:protein disulfide-isomerase